MEFISFDLETTGTLSHVDQIIEVAGIRFFNGEPVQTYQNLVQIDIPIPKAASDINGITDDMLKGQKRISEVLPDFVNFCKDHILVAHNAVFDFQFLQQAIKDQNIFSPNGLIFDTYKMARRMFPNLKNYKLATLSEYLGINVKNFHRAESDAIACGYLFQEILNKLPAKNLKELNKLFGKTALKFSQNFSQGQLSLF